MSDGVTILAHMREIEEMFVRDKRYGFATSQRKCRNAVAALIEREAALVARNSFLKADRDVLLSQRDALAARVAELEAEIANVRLNAALGSLADRIESVDCGELSPDDQAVFDKARAEACNG